MKVYALLLLLYTVDCWGIRWKTIDDFKETFKEYSTAAANTITSIESVVDNSKSQSELFLNNTYSNNPIVSRVTGMRSSMDKCFAKFMDKENLKFSFQIQVYQLQVPLQSRVVDIRERLNNIHSSLDIYQGLAESKFRSCKSVNGSCMEETDEWLESTINSLSCAIFPNCSDRSVNKRSVSPQFRCGPNQFNCNGRQCIQGNYFCDGGCDCGSGCTDEPPGCVRSCLEFRCSVTYRCISLSKQCNGFDDCGDGSDEDGCPPTFTPPEPTTPSYTHANCSVDAGDYLCSNGKCIGLEYVCDGYNDCGDWSDEVNCHNSQCSPECRKKGGICFIEPKGPKCLYECPPGTYETSTGCSRNPEVPLPTLLQVLEDTPRLITRYSARLKFLKTKTIMAFSKSLRELVKCKQEEFTLLSKIIDFSSVVDEYKRSIEDNSPPITATPRRTGFEMHSALASSSENPTSTSEGMVSEDY